MGIRAFLLIYISMFSAGFVGQAHADADPARGAELFRQCAACHSVKPNEHLTGPSLSGIVGSNAGTAEGFGRYSNAMRQSDIVWTEDALDAWLMSPADFLPGTSMRIEGIQDAGARRDLIAYLESLETHAEGSGKSAPGAGGGGMMGRGGKPRLVDLKELSPSRQVSKIRYCGDAYYVTLGTGDTYTFWEFNLRIKTDSSERGPVKGKPAILQGGMMGDRAFVIFSGPGEISRFINQAC